MTNQQITIHLPPKHEKQDAFVSDPTKRKVVRAGRQSGKTVGSAKAAVIEFLKGNKVLYAAPTITQVEQFWQTVKNSLHEPIEANLFQKNETIHQIELPGTRQRIRAKTAWNADSLRGDSEIDLLILDEFQLMNEETWGKVGAPMLLARDGNAIFIYTPPSLHSRSVSKADDPRHAAKLFQKAKEDTSGRWKAFHFTSHDNPHLSKIALDEISNDMTSQAVRQEILAIDEDEAVGALWKRRDIDDLRKIKAPDLGRVVVGVDPSATSTGDEAGIVTAGRAGDEYFVLADNSLQGSPATWAKEAVTAYHLHKANCIVAEANNGGEMVEQVIKQVDRNVPVKLVHASRGKATRAEPIAAIYEKGRAHHVGDFPKLEDEMCMWVPGDASPNRMDALVWAMTELVVKQKATHAKFDWYNPPTKDIEPPKPYRTDDEIDRLLGD